MWLERTLSSIQHCFLVQVPRYFTTNSELTAWHKAICFNNSMPLRKSLIQFVWTLFRFIQSVLIIKAWKKSFPFLLFTLPIEIWAAVSSFNHLFMSNRKLLSPI